MERKRKKQYGNIKIGRGKERIGTLKKIKIGKIQMKLEQILKKKDQIFIYQVPFFSFESHQNLNSQPLQLSLSLRNVKERENGIEKG